MPRFFVPSVNFSETSVKITGDDARHIARSLRMAEGDSVTICDMHGNEHNCTLTRIRDEECECVIVSSKKGENEPPVKITLYMAYPKADKLEYIVQKAVELGASEIIPFESERCIKRPAPEKAEKNTARLQRIASEAAKQCGRSTLPIVKAPISYKSALAEAIKAAMPAAAKREKNPCKRTFQAIRIEVNGELVHLERALESAFNVLKPGGKLAIITFHSLEDGMVKRKYKEWCKGCTCPKDFPICVCGNTPKAKMTPSKAIEPSVSEQEENPRSKCARLRVLEKL